MKIYTLNVGQGQFVVVVGATEALVVDTSIPLNPAHPIEFVKGALANILSGRKFVGLVVTGFDADHFNEVGVKLVLNKYRPDWIIYPRYFKKSTAADAGFSAINEFEKQKEIKKYSISLGDNTKRFYETLSTDFTFEVFSPHKEDMDSSNNSSLVCKIKEKSTGATYLVTGDTENARWDRIAQIFGASLKSDVLDAPHHGSKNGISKAAIQLIKPHTVLISAGVKNSYGHPDAEAVKLFTDVGANVYCTKDASKGSSSSLVTTADGRTVKTQLYTSPA